MKLSDTASGIILLVFSIVFWTAAHGLPNPVSQLYGPAFFPQWIAVATGICAVIMIATSIRELKSQSFVFLDEWARDPRRLLRFLLVPAAVIVYVYIVDLFGFIPAAMAILFVLLLSLGARLVVALPTTVGIVLLIYAIFDMLLRVPLPRGSLFFD